MKSKFGSLCISIAALAAFAAAARGETVTVPLSDPSRPAVIKAELINGGITVESWTGKEVVVEAVGRDDDDDKGEKGRRHKGKHDDDGDLDSSIDHAVDEAVRGALAGEGDDDEK